jgi:hypothetical protein
MQYADSNIRPTDLTRMIPDSAARAVPTFIAADLLEKLITDRDARAVDRVVGRGRK